MGVFAVIAGLFGLAGGLLFGIPATLFGSLLLVRRRQSVGIVLRAWIHGAVVMGLAWGILSTWITEFPDGHGPPSAEDWSSFIGAVTLWAVLPGAMLVGGGTAQVLRVILRRPPSPRGEGHYQEATSSGLGRSLR